jgi:hypothetical protein
VSGVALTAAGGEDAKRLGSSPLTGSLVVPELAEPPEDPPAEQTSEPATPETVSLVIDSTPSKVEVHLDGKLLGRAPGPIVLPYAAEPIELSFVHAGYRSETKAVTADHDDTVEVKLTRAADPVAKPSPASEGDPEYLRWKKAAEERRKKEAAGK